MFAEMAVHMNHEELTFAVRILVEEQLNSLRVENEQSYLFDAMTLKYAHISAFKNKEKKLFLSNFENVTVNTGTIKKYYALLI